MNTRQQLGLVTNQPYNTTKNPENEPLQFSP
jgi:hypothetical protein